MTPEDNFNIGFHLFNIAQPKNQMVFEEKSDRHQKLLDVLDKEHKAVLTKFRKVKFGFFERLRTSKEKMDAELSSVAFKFLQTAAEHGNRDARVVLLQVVTSRMNKEGKKPPLYTEFLANDELFRKVKSFDELGVKFQNAILHQKEKKEFKEEKIAASFFKAPKEFKELSDDEKDIEGIIARLRTVIHRAWNKDTEESLKKNGIDLTEINELLYPSLDENLNMDYLKKLSKEISEKIKTPRIKESYDVEVTLKSMLIVINNTGEILAEGKKYSHLHRGS